MRCKHLGKIRSVSLVRNKRIFCRAVKHANAQTRDKVECKVKKSVVVIRPFNTELNRYTVLKVYPPVIADRSSRTAFNWEFHKIARVEIQRCDAIVSRQDLAKLFEIEADWLAPLKGDKDLMMAHLKI